MSVIKRQLRKLALRLLTLRYGKDAAADKLLNAAVQILGKNVATKRLLHENKNFRIAQKKTVVQQRSACKRYDVINFLLEQRPDSETAYLEIGVRNPDANFNKIAATRKISVDPGVEYADNPVDYPITSDEFFSKMRSRTIPDAAIRFDVIFIDGLHLADQVWRDINNALEFLTDDGWIVLHDCNPPTEWHARETYEFRLNPARGAWNGTTWKAFTRYRKEGRFSSCTIDTDFGIGCINKQIDLGGDRTLPQNGFYEYKKLNLHRKQLLNLLSFDEFKRIVHNATTTRDGNQAAPGNNRSPLKNR